MQHKTKHLKEFLSQTCTFPPLKKRLPHATILMTDHHWLDDFATLSIVTLKQSLASKRVTKSPNHASNSISRFLPTLSELRAGEWVGVKKAPLSSPKLQQQGPRFHELSQGGGTQVFLGFIARPTPPAKRDFHEKYTTECHHPTRKQSIFTYNKRNMPQTHAKIFVYMQNNQKPQLPITYQAITAATLSLRNCGYIAL